MRTLWLLTLIGCSGAQAPGLSGALDLDGDGWSAAAGDCNDTNDAVFPGAVDLPGDNIDQDCDGADDLALPVGGLAPGDLVITEVLRDPLAVDGDLGEWFEVHNALDVDVDLQGLLVLDDDRDDFTVATSLIVEAGGYVVFGGWDDPLLNGGAPVDLRWEADFGLSNDQDAIRLMVDLQPIDEVRWDITWPDGDGEALSLDVEADATLNDEVGNWCLAKEVFGPGGMGSPGVENPECPDAFDGWTLAEVADGDVVITEIMKQPAAADPSLGEWVEVYNAADEDISLLGLELRDANGSGVTVETDLVLEEGAFMVFATTLDVGANGGVDAALAWGDEFALNNGGDTVELGYGAIVLDRVDYDNGVTFPDIIGASLQLDPSQADNSIGAAWCAGTLPFGDGDLGTPGTANLPCTGGVPTIADLAVGDLVITEILNEPTAGGNDGEWFELRNLRNDEVELAGLVIRDDAGDSHTLAGSVRLAAYGLLVLGRETDLAVNGGAPVDYAYGNDLTLGNDEDELVLEAGALEIDRVAWDAGVSFPDGAGASMSLDGASQDAMSNDLGASWCLGDTAFGDGDLGTPGVDNPGC